MAAFFRSILSFFYHRPVLQAAFAYLRNPFAGKTRAEIRATLLSRVGHLNEIAMVTPNKIDDALGAFALVAVSNDTSFNLAMDLLGVPKDAPAPAPPTPEVVAS
jgi:hypothetical protein